jgi:hypothetical protein
MKIQDGGVGKLTVLCDSCGAPLDGQATVALNHQQIVSVHSWCVSAFSQFFTNGARRTLSLSQFVDELVAASEP